MSLKSTRNSSNLRYSPYQVKGNEGDSKSETKSEPLKDQTEDESPSETNNSSEKKSPRDSSSKTTGEVAVPAKNPSPSKEKIPETPTDPSEKTETKTSLPSETLPQKQTPIGYLQPSTSSSSSSNLSTSRSPPTTAYLPPTIPSRNAFSSTSSSSYLPPTSTAVLAPPGPPQPLGASRVIHFRNVGSSITKEDLLGIASPFGVVDQVVLMRSKNQALCQMQQLEAAVNLMEFYTRNPCAIRGKRIYLGFSRHQGLAAATPVNRIVLVTMQTDHQQSLFPYYINTDVIKHIFSTHGYVEKIVIITKPDKDLQALVQFNSPESAVQAMQYLNTQTIYLGTDSVIPITLDLQFSNLTELTVKQNCDKSRDYSGLFQPPIYQPAAVPNMAYGQVDPMAHMQMQMGGAQFPDYNSYYQ